ncbi:MAG TPA: pyridoxamine 5'-phosphate oxidase family protein [Pyrinomonadaceae bacterium]|nr:pyridoxamine 5'-phosphate oxidase family protein [Pyrinomonadaceae bacterium]
MGNTRQESIEKLKELIEDIDFCMLTTVDGGHFRSRPMSTQEFEFDGDLWFFTSDNTHKVAEIQQDDRVNVAYSKPDDSRFVSVSGRGEIVKDRAKIEELWSPVLKAWFPDGLEDPTLCLLLVKVEEAEYWDQPSGMIVQTLGFIKALATGSELNTGENEKIRFRSN